MAIAASSTRGRVGTKITVTITPDAVGTQPFTDDLAVADIAVAGGSLVAGSFTPVPGTANNTFTEASFDVMLPETAGTVTVTVAAAAVTGIASDLVVTLTAVEFRTGRADANPAAKNYGTNLLGIVAEQSDYFSPVQLESNEPDPETVDSLYPNVIELRPPYTLTPTRQFYEVERLKGNASPDPSIPGMLMGQGELNFYLDPQQADFWLKHLLQTTTVTSVPGKVGDASANTEGLSSAYRILGASYNFPSGAAYVVPTGSQPVDKLASDKKSDDDETATIRYNSSDDSDSWDFYAFPFTGLRAAKLKIMGASGSTTTYRVTGVDHNDAPLTEDVVVQTALIPATETEKAIPGNTGFTKFYYKDKVKISRVSGTKNLASVDCDLSDLYLHTMKFSSDVSEGLTLEIQEGNTDTPIIYNGMLIQRGIFTLEEVARMQMSVIANEVLPRKAIHTDETDEKTGTNLTHFGRTDFKAVPAPGMSWEVQGDDVPEAMRGVYRIAQIAMAIDNRLEPPATSFAEDFSYPKPVRKRNRELQMQVAIDHSKEADFDQFVGGLTFRSLFTAASKSYGDAYRAIRLITEQTQLINNPTRVVNNLGEVLQQIVFRGHIGNDPDGNDEATMEVLNTNETF